MYGASLELRLTDTVCKKIMVFDQLDAIAVVNILLRACRKEWMDLLIS
jgi:hypothetical protein